jgi:DNA polymerase bacteriophage-type
MNLFWDVETRSAASLRLVGPWNYATRSTTEILCLCYAVDDGEVQTWTNQSLLGAPEQPVPEPFLAAARDSENWRLIAHNTEFERAILEHVLIPKHGFPSIPLEAQHCSMTSALASGYPAELETLAEALELPYKKDREGRKLMREMSQPRKPRRGEDKSILHWVFDAERLARLVEYCAQDTRTARAIWLHSKIKPLSEEERRYQVLDAIINRRGVRADRELAARARDMAARERDAINAMLRDYTNGKITSIDQVGRILNYATERGHAMTSVGKRSVSAVLAAKPDEETRKVLELRRDGARSSVRKYERILAYASPDDDRMRGTMRMYGAGPGRWSGRGPQLQNLKKNEHNIPLAAVEAVRSEDRAQLRAYGNPLTVLGDIARADICAVPDCVLMTGDFSQVESRALAWHVGEEWKLQVYREFDRTGDKAKEPYRIVAAKMLQRDDVAGINKEERNKGKAGDLACGFGGGGGAWRRIAHDDKRTDEEIAGDIRAWRDAHPKTVAYWRELMRAIRIAIRTGQPYAARAIVAEYTDGNLALVLPSKRRITYPQARLVESRFEGAPPDVVFKDNARGKWADYRGWFGTFIENVVQGTARDLLAAAIERFEARGIHIVLHVHDEAVAEVPIGSISEADFLAILLEPPAWATGLPLAGTVRSGTHYLEPPEADAALPIAAEPAPSEAVIEAILTTPPETDAPIAEAQEEATFLSELSEDVAPLWDLASVPQTTDGKTTCPFHEDPNPSLKFYADHYYCFGCNARGGRLDWLMQGEGLRREEAIAVIRDWNGPVQRRPVVEEKTVKIARARELWQQAHSIRGTLAERYLSETRGIDVSQLPANLEASLRFHSDCPFGSTKHPCLLALMQETRAIKAVGIQRIALAQQDGRVTKIDRHALGKMGVVKLWAPAATLVIGEGLETTLAAATAIPFNDEPLRPAWAMVSADQLGGFAVIPGVERLIILVDHDPTGVLAASTCMERWTRAGRTVVRLTPERAGEDFNDLILPELTPSAARTRSR